MYDIAAALAASALTPPDCQSGLPLRVGSCRECAGTSTGVGIPTAPSHAGRFQREPCDSAARMTWWAHLHGVTLQWRRPAMASPCNGVTLGSSRDRGGSDRVDRPGPETQGALVQLFHIVRRPSGDPGHGEDGAAGVGRHARVPQLRGQGEVAVGQWHVVGRCTDAMTSCTIARGARRSRAAPPIRATRRSGRRRSCRPRARNRAADPAHATRRSARATRRRARPPRVVRRPAGSRRRAAGRPRWPARPAVRRRDRSAPRPPRAPPWSRWRSRGPP